MLLFHSCERVGEGGKEVGGVEGEGGGTGEEWEGRWKRMRDGEEEESKGRRGEDGGGRGPSMREMKWGEGDEVGRGRE